MSIVIRQKCKPIWQADHFIIVVYKLLLTQTLRSLLLSPRWPIKAEIKGISYIHKENSKGVGHINVKKNNSNSNNNSTRTYEENKDAFLFRIKENIPIKYHSEFKGSEKGNKINFMAEDMISNVKK